MKKKVLLAMLAVALVFGMTLAGCKDESGDTTPPDSIEGTWKGSGTVPRAVFTDTDWTLFMAGSEGRDEDSIAGTYTYSNGTATLTPAGWATSMVSGGTATASGNKMTIVINWVGGSPETFRNLIKQ
jgi:hypothetical protein